MFLRFLSPAQRQAVLLMAYRMVAADGAIRDEETSMLDALRAELGLTAPKREVYQAGPDLSVLTDRRSKVAAMLKLAAIAYSDRDFHPEEVRTLVRFGKGLGLSAEDMQAIDSWGRRHESLVSDASALIGPAEDTGHVPDALAKETDADIAVQLLGKTFPGLHLPQAMGGEYDLAIATSTRRIIVCYSVTATPGQDLPASWADIPDAQDSTALLSALRDRWSDLRDMGAELIAVSAQTQDCQKELAKRLGLRFPLLSDSRLALTRALSLPSVDVAGVSMLRRLTLVVKNGVVEHVFFPIAQPEGHADQLVEWLEANPT